MKEKKLELIYIGSRHLTNDQKSHWRALKFIDIITEEEYIMHLRDDESAAALEPRVGDIYTGLDLLVNYSSTKNPSITLGSEFMKKEGLLARAMHTFQLVGTDKNKTLVFKNYNSLLIITRNGVSNSFRVTLLKDHTTNTVEVESFQTITQNEIANRFYINLKKYS